MTILLSGDKTKEIIDLLQDMSQKLMFGNMASKDIAAVMMHYEVMRKEKSPMACGTKFEVVPELLLTRITIECSFSPEVVGQVKQ